MAEFFSFGTNDLTQATMGLSRDDAGKFLPAYVETGILPKDPFVSLDTEGVGALVRLAIERGRKAKSTLKLGVCGEHGGDPESIRFFHGVGLDYVSCSPFRVPIARLAAAQAALLERPAPRARTSGPRSRARDPSVPCGIEGGRRSSMAKMKAVQVSKANAPLRGGRARGPEPGDRQVRIKVEACGICHSDAFVRAGAFPGIVLPRIPGTRSPGASTRSARA